MPLKSIHLPNLSNNVPKVLMERTGQASRIHDVVQLGLGSLRKTKVLLGILQFMDKVLHSTSRKL